MVDCRTSRLGGKGGETGRNKRRFGSRRLLGGSCHSQCRYRNACCQRVQGPVYFEMEFVSHRGVDRAFEALLARLITVKLLLSIFSVMKVTGQCMPRYT